MCLFLGTPFPPHKKRKFSFRHPNLNLADWFTQTESIRFAPGPGTSSTEANGKAFLGKLPKRIRVFLTVSAGACQKMDFVASL